MASMMTDKDDVFGTNPDTCMVNTLERDSGMKDTKKGERRNHLRQPGHIVLSVLDACSTVRLHLRSKYHGPASVLAQSSCTVLVTFPSRALPHTAAGSDWGSRYRPAPYLQMFIQLGSG